MVHPDDRAAVEARERTRSSPATAATSTDYRMVRPDGRIVWIRDRAFAHRDEEGRVPLGAGILFDVTELKDAEARIAHMAFHDGLTGLANRQLFEGRWSSPWNVRGVTRSRGGRALPGSRQLQAGQRYVRPPRRRPPPSEVAQRLRDSTRGTDLVARQGGDEFLILLADLETAGAGTTSRHSPGADLIHEALRRPFRPVGVTFARARRSASACIPNDAYDAEDVLKNADIVMYRAKRLEPGGHAFFAADADDADDATGCRSRRACARRSRTRAGCCTTSPSSTSPTAASSAPRR